MALDAKLRFLEKAALLYAGESRAVSTHLMSHSQDLRAQRDSKPAHCKLPACEACGTLHILGATETISIESTKPKSKGIALGQRPPSQSSIVSFCNECLRYSQLQIIKKPKFKAAARSNRTPFTAAQTTSNQDTKTDIGKKKRRKKVSSLQEQLAKSEARIKDSRAELDLLDFMLPTGN